MKLKFLVIALLTFALGIAQEKGTVTGTVTDKDMNNESLPFASVAVKGTTIGTTTDENGAYSLQVPAGNHTLVFGFLGYESAEMQLSIQAGETKTINQALGSTSVTLQDVIIEKVVNREKETALLLEQKNAVTITQSIGAQEMSRKGVSDAEGAVTKVTGISKQQGENNVFVRGLGDRYNSTTLNGLPLPSEDPTTKNISLDFFSSNVIKNIGVNKTFSSFVQGDNAGANIDIISKEFVGRDYLEVGVSSGVNSQTIGSDFYTIDGENFMGFSDKEAHVNNLNDYSFENKLDPNKSGSALLNTGLSIRGGKRWDVGEKNSFSMFLTGSFANSYLYREGKARQNNGAGTIYMDMDFKKYTYNVSQTLMGNFKYKFGTKNSISLNSLYIHDNTQDIGDYFGFNTPEDDGDLDFLKRQQTNNNSIFVNQLLSEIAVSDNVGLDLGVAYNMIRTSEPDRRSNLFLYRDGYFRPNSDSGGSHERYFGTMNEDEVAGRGIANFTFNEGKSRIDAGFDARYTKRSFEALVFNHNFVNSEYPADLGNIDAIFNQQSLDNGLFTLTTGRGSSMDNPNTWLPFYYDGTKSIIGGLASFTHTFSEKLTLVVGARFDKINLEVDYNTNIATNETFGDARIDEGYILPNFNLKYNVNENSIFRLAGSMSYTMPQFIEIAPFKYQGPQWSQQGNNNLVPSENMNLDLKWEYYPESDELIAVTGFYKHIDNPINRAEVPVAGNTLTFFNTGATATVAGAELELKKNIYKVTSAETNNETVLSGGLNVSYLYTRQDLNRKLVASFNVDNDQLQGASPILANADISFARNTEKFDFTSSLVLNYFSDRIFSIGTRGLENAIEKGVPTLDFITQAALGEHFSIGFKARNLLNPDIRIVREEGANTPEVELSTFKMGLDFSLGLTYKF